METQVSKPNTPLALPRLLTVEQVAQHTGFCARQIYRWIKNKDLKAVPFGRKWRIAENDLAYFIATRT